MVLLILTREIIPPPSINLGYLLIVITNQGGLDKKLYDLNELHAMHNYFQGKCVTNGFEISHFYFCPHHPEFTGNCLCRKPGSLLIEKAIHRFNVDPSQSFMIGDRDRDVQCAEAAGVKGIKIVANSEIPLPENLINTQ
jgi:D-glycero-D-manno-heptose 1,7-bisphosphate phosphatase